MRNLLEVCCPSSSGPTSASSSLRRTSPHEDRSWRLPGGSQGMPRSPLWGSRLALRRSPAMCLSWASHSLSLVLREWRLLRAGPCTNFGPVFGTAIGVEKSAHAATTFRLAARTVIFNDPETLPNQAHLWAWFLQDVSEACLCWVI